MSNAAHILLWQCSFRNLHIKIFIIGIVIFFHCDLHVITKLTRKLDIANIDENGSFVEMYKLFIKYRLQHCFVALNETLRKWAHNVRVVICSNEEEIYIRVVFISILISVRFGVISNLSSKRWHFFSSHAKCVLNYSFAWNCLDVVFSVEHIGDVNCPILEAILDLLHF